MISASANNAVAPPVCRNTTLEPFSIVPLRIRSSTPWKAFLARVSGLSRNQVFLFKDYLGTS